MRQKQTEYPANDSRTSELTQWNPGKLRQPKLLRTGLGIPSISVERNRCQAATRFPAGCPCNAQPQSTVPNRLAQVGSGYYDPFSGLPML